MPEEGESLETLSVGIEADISKLIAGARAGVEQVDEILTEIVTPTLKVNTLPLLGKITEVINRYTELQLTVEQVVGAINAGMGSGASAVEQLAGSMLEYSAIQQQSMAMTKRDFFDMGIATQEGMEGAIQHLVQLGSQYGATQQEVIAFASQMDQARTALHEMGMATVQTGESVVRVAPLIGEVVTGFRELGELPLAQQIAVINQGLGENATKVQEITSLLLEYAQVQGKTAEGAALALWEEGVLNTQELSEALGLLQSLGSEFSASTQEVEAFKAQLLEAHVALTEMWKPVDAAASSWMDQTDQVTALGESVRITDQLTQQMNENTRAGLAANDALFEKLIYSQGELSTAPWDEMSEGLERVFEGLGGVTLSQEQATAAITVGSQQSSSEIQQMTGNIVQLSQVVGKPFQDVTELLLSMGVISVETADKVVASLRKIATTEVNESPLSISLKSIQGLLDGIITRAQQATTEVTGLGRQVPTQRLAQVGIIPKPGLIQRAGQRITAIYDQIKAAGTAAIGRLTHSFASLRTAEDSAAAGASNLSTVIQQGMQEGASMVDQLAAFVARLAQENDLAVDTVVSGLVDSRQITKETGTDIMGVFEGTKKGAGGLGKALGSLGGIVKSVFGVAFGLTAIQALKKVIALMMEAAKVTIQYQTDLVRLDIAVRAAQRVQGDAIGTIAGWRDHIRELGEEFDNLSRTQLVEGAAQTVLLTRELKLNEDQMMRVYRAAATLASLHGIKMSQALTLVVQGLTGIGRGLRRYGVFLSRAQLNQEALNLGLKESWTDLDSNERALVALNVIMRQVEPVVEDLGHLYGTLGGRVQVATANLEDAQAELGRIGAPLVVMWKESLAAVLTFVGTAVKALSHLVAIVVASGYAIHTFTETLKETGNAALAALAAQEAWGKGLVSISQDLGLLGPALKDVSDGFVDFGDVGDEELEELLETLEKFGGRFEKALMDYQRSLADAAEDLEEKLVDLQKDYERDLEEALEDLMHAMEDLERQYTRKRADIIQDAQDKLARLEQEGRDKRAKSLRDYLVKMHRMWEDHQIKLRRMREDFEESMRGAVSKRDAWAAVQAIRSYVKDRRRAIEDYGLRRSRAEEDFARRMGDMDEQNEAERRKILEAKERELEDLEIWRARRRDEINEDYDEELEDLKIENARQEEEIRRSYAQRLEDIQLALERKLADIAEAMADEKDITTEGARDVFRELFKVFGFGGDIDQLMDAFEARLARNIKIRVAVEQAYISGPGPGQIPGMQHGGTIVANKPTLAMFGEAGPEAATFTPLNQWSRMATAAHHAGTLKIEVSADEHFSADFEELVAHQLSQFVRRVVA